MSCVIKHYCDICKGLIEEDQVLNLSLINETYDLCRKCGEELEEKIAEMENEKTSDLTF